MPGNYYIDETKQRGLLMVAAVVLPGDVTETRRQVKTLYLPGQNRIHMKDERAGRKRQILDLITGMGAIAVVYDGSGIRPQHTARSLCIARLVEDAHAVGAHHLVFELDDTLRASDRRDVVATERRLGIKSPDYRHMRATEEPLLCLADAIAWAWAKGGEWRASIQPIVTVVSVT